MTIMHRLIVFDCDGTLVDSQHAITAAMASAWGACGLDPAPGIAAVRRIVGLPLAQAIAILHPTGTPDVLEAMVEAYKAAFFAQRQRPDHDEPLYPGVRETLDGLRSAGYLLAVATGKSRRGLLATLDRHGLLQHFAILKTADDGPGKPAPDILLDAMSALGVSASDTVMVGDTVFDIAMARAAGTYALGVDWGYHAPEDLMDAGAHAVLSDCLDLPAWLASLWRA